VLLAILMRANTGAPKGKARGFRLDAALDAKLEEIAKRMSSPYHEMPIAAVIRAALLEGLAVLDAKLPPLEESPSRIPARRTAAKRGRKKQ
jgi:hypothetical protein